MTTLLPTPLEEAAKAMHSSQPWSSFWSADDALLLATAAITAYLVQAGKEGWVMVPAFHLANLRAADKRITSVPNRGSDTAEHLVQLECLLAWPNVQGLLAAAQNGGEPCK